MSLKYKILAAIILPIIWIGIAYYLAPIQIFKGLSFLAIVSVIVLTFSIVRPVDMAILTIFSIIAIIITFIALG